MKSLLEYRRLLIWAAHILTIAAALLVAFLLRFDFALRGRDLYLFYVGIAVAIPLKLILFHFGRVDRGWWLYVSISDVARLAIVNALGSSLLAVVLITAFRDFPRSVLLMDLVLCFLLTCGMRVGVRMYRELVVGELSRAPRTRVLVYGAGSAGIALVREIRSNPSLGYEVVGFLDDNLRKKDAVFCGIRVLGSGRDLAQIVDRRTSTGAISEVIIAIPSASGRQIREAISACRAVNLACKTVPGFGELLSGRFLSSQIRQVAVEDLLGRQPVRLDYDEIRHHIYGRCILVTGAAGSIGSELCRQIAAFAPSKLIILDQAESELFKVEQELRRTFSALTLCLELADIRDQARLEEVFQAHTVESVMHAAAYKHVHLMESHVLEAVGNNILGTWNLARAAYNSGVKHFLMISSDKAVNPTNVMGVTKRVAELVVAATPACDSNAATRFVSVRFGNVLGSNGSVVPIFQSQIAAGGPVTVTHPDVQRYFMTIREAVQLVLQASTMGRGSEVFVLDMGEPVRIVDLANNMIRLAGLAPGEDIEIRFTGLRPGEKLFEEVALTGENVVPTFHDKIQIFRGPKVDRARILEWLVELQTLLRRRDAAAVVQHLQAIVPEYTPSTMWSTFNPSRQKLRVTAHAATASFAAPIRRQLT